MKEQKQSSGVMPNTVEPTGDGVLGDSEKDGWLNDWTCSCGKHNRLKWQHCARCFQPKPSGLKPVTSDRRGS